MTIFLVDVDGESSRALKDQVEGQTYLEVHDREELVGALVAAPQEPELVVLGAKVEEPARVAQTVWQAAGNVPVIIQTELDQIEQLMSTLRFTPLIGTDVRCVAMDAPDQLVKLACDAILQ